MLSPAGCQNSLCPAPPLLRVRLGGLCLAGWAALPPPRLPPTSPCSMHRLSALPTLFRGPLVYTWLRRVRLLVSWWFSGLFRQMWVESKRSAGCGEPSILLCCHLLPVIYLDSFIKFYFGGTWVAQLVKCLSLDISSGCDLAVVRPSPRSGSVLGTESAWDSLSSHPPPTLSLSCSFPLPNK